MELRTIEGFLLGVISATSIIAGVFFLKFWKASRDSLFLAFAAAFFIEGLDRVVLLTLRHPNEGAPIIYVVRLLTYLLILAAILKKNYRRG